MVTEVDTIHAPGGTQRAQVLGYLGLLPFAAGAVLSWLRLPLSGPDFPALALQGVLLYAAVILSFMAGARWGTAIATGQMGRLYTAIAISLVAWIAVLPAEIMDGFAPSYEVRVFVLLMSFLALYFTEIRTRENAPWYQRLRGHLTTGVVMALLTILLGVRVQGPIY